MSYTSTVAETFHIPHIQTVSPLAWVRHALTIRRERAALAQLGSHDLQDLGLSPHDVWGESNRPFWELPDNRRW